MQPEQLLECNKMISEIWHDADFVIADVNTIWGKIGINNDSWLTVYIMHIYIYKSLRISLVVWYFENWQKLYDGSNVYISFYLRMLTTISKHKKALQNKSFSGLNVRHERFILTVIPVLLISSVSLVLCYLLPTIAMSVVNPASSDKICNIWPDEITRPYNSRVVLAAK